MALKHRPMGQWSRLEDPEINTHIYGQLTYDKKAKRIVRKGQISINGPWRCEHLHAKE